MKELIYGSIAAIVMTGFAYAMDQRVDERVENAIDSYDERQITRDIEQIILLEETAPDLVTSRDKAERRILEKQLNQLQRQRME